jgi:hypothetical protein
MVACNQILAARQPLAQELHSFKPTVSERYILFILQVFVILSLQVVSAPMGNRYDDMPTGSFQVGSKPSSCCELGG